MKKALIIPSLLMLLFTVSCHAETRAESSLRVAGHVVYGESDYQKLSIPNNRLGFQLLTLVEEDDVGNFLISPTSLMMALGMVYNGADGNTKKEIAEAMQLKGIDVKTFNQANASLMMMLDKHTDHLTLAVANSIWMNDQFRAQERYTHITRDYFNAKVQEVSMADVKTPDLINEWVIQRTNGTIEKLIEGPLNEDVVAVLMNAIYFKGNWTFPFDKSLTEDRPFYKEDGETVEVPLMYLNEELPYMENEYFQAVRLPYGETENLSMHLFLPKENETLESFYDHLTIDNWISWKHNFRIKAGSVLLPKFKLDYESDLVQPLKRLGMTAAFDKNLAEFPHMIEEDEQIYISEVKQKTYIDVNEAGTEASAATSIEMRLTSAPADGPFHMEVNRPFFFAIVDHHTDAILFMGSIKQP